MHIQFLIVKRHARGFLARKACAAARYKMHVVTCQRFVRGWLARLHYKRIRRGFILVESHWRRKVAKREYLKLRVLSFSHLFCYFFHFNLIFLSFNIACLLLQVEARSVENLQKMNRGLENKIIELVNKLDDKVNTPIFFVRFGNLVSL